MEEMEPEIELSSFLRVEAEAALKENIILKKKYKN